MMNGKGAAGAAMLLVLLIPAGCGGRADPGADAGAAATILDYPAAVPVSWTARETTNEMRLAEYAIPAAAGAESAEVVVYYFGPGQGGSVEANIARWTGQFTTPDGGAVEPVVSPVADAAFPTTLVELEGSYGRGIGMGPGRDEARPGQALVAAVVETPKGNLFIQLFGPVAEVEAARAGFLTFVRSIGG